MSDYNFNLVVCIHLGSKPYK